MKSSIQKKEWPLVALGEIATLQRGYDLPVKKRTEGDFVVFAANGPHGTHNENKARGPGVITGRSGTIGKVHFSNDDFWPLNTALYVKEFHGNDPKWVFYMLQNFRLERFSQGAGVPTLNRNLVHGVQIPLPSLAEQKRIAAILDKADAIRRKRQAAIKLADDFLRATFLDMFGDPVTNPKGWEVKTLGEMVQIQIGPFGTQLHKKDYIEGGIPLINPSHIVSGKLLPSKNTTIISEKHAQLPEYHLRPGDIIMGRRGEMGRCAVVSDDENGWLCGTGSLFMRYDQTILNPQYFYAVLSSSALKVYLENESLGATLPNLNKGIISNIKLPVPPIELQERYVEIAGKRKSILEKAALDSTAGHDLFNSLTQRAFQGEL